MIQKTTKRKPKASLLLVETNHRHDEAAGVGVRCRVFYVHYLGLDLMLNLRSRRTPLWENSVPTPTHPPSILALGIMRAS